MRKKGEVFAPPPSGICGIDLLMELLETDRSSLDDSEPR